MSSMLESIQIISDKLHEVVKGDCPFRIFHVRFLFPSILPVVIVVAITNSRDNLEWLGIQHQQYLAGDRYGIAVFEGKFDMYQELRAKQKAMEFPECENLVDRVHFTSLKEALEALEVQGGKIAEAQELLQEIHQKKREMEEVDMQNSWGLGALIRAILGYITSR